MTTHEDRDATEPRHPIAVVSQRTGISQDVLRVWERRYGSVQPTRSTDGRRLYSDQDVQRLRLMRSAVEGGRSIGSVAPLDTPSLELLVEEDTRARPDRVEPTASGAPRESQAERLIGEALSLTRAMDAIRLDAGLRRGVSLLGLREFIDRVAVPLLRQVGADWHAGRMTPGQEHLVSGVLHDIAAQAMRSLAAGGGAARVVVGTPAGDRHAIGAALVGASAALAGWEVVYLGADLPAAEITAAAAATGADLVALSVVFLDDPERVIAELRSVRDQLPSRARMVVGGSGAERLEAALADLGIPLSTSLGDWPSPMAAAPG